ncbi:hypothetical protein Bbelb_271000 [Branchiostoma belcheri]|nr:hypothetical protein Bbelb_271000 [Branchiostoma belcheri]
MYVRISVDSRPYRDELRARYARAGNELCDLKNRRRLVADVKNTFRVSASFGRLQKIAGDPENSRDARRNIGRTTAAVREDNSPPPAPLMNTDTTTPPPPRHVFTTHGALTALSLRPEIGQSAERAPRSPWERHDRHER